MQYGQGKDLNANLRRTRGYGSGWENVGQFIGGAVNAGFGASKGNADLAMKGLSLMGSSLDSFAGKVNVNKQMSSGSLDLTTLASNPMKGLVAPTPLGSVPSSRSINLGSGLGFSPQAQGQDLTASGGLAAKAASTSMDMGAGYNPQSETFRSGSGQTITDRNKTFEQLATEALMKDNTLTASKGRRINYLSFFN